jgi:hypothetical protein
MSLGLVLRPNQVAGDHIPRRGREGPGMRTKHTDQEYLDGREA